MEKMKMHSLDVIGSNIEKIQQLFPNCVTERLAKDGKPELAIDFEKLQAELSNEITGEGEERYQFTWPDKRAANRLANTPTTMTLRPCREESVDFDHTQNLYIEGDNLDVLKALRETYLGKVKMIYIDPPYNTGNDFVYNDEYNVDKEEEEGRNGLFDEDGNQTLSQYERNTASNGRFHTNWLNMIYPRLKVARDLLSDDGVIFISIDDNEVENLRKICDEIFGENNFIAQQVWTNKEGGGGSDSKHIRIKHEYIVTYSKNIEHCHINGVDIENEERYTKSDEYVNVRGKYYLQQLSMGSLGYIESLDFPITAPDGTLVYPNKDNKKVNRWRWGYEKVQWGLENGYIEFNKDKNGLWVVSTKQYLKADNDGNIINRTNRPFALIDKYSSTLASKKLQELLAGKIFDYSKPVGLLHYISFIASNKDSVILDFFSGSATTAHAVMQLNAEDGGNRKFIMVQLPEKTDEKSEAYKAGYKNICEIGKERIRRAARKICEERGVNKLKAEIEELISQRSLVGDDFWTTSEKLEAMIQEKEAQLNKLLSLDTGFRVLKLDSSNMEEVYYTPQEFTPQSLFNENVKADRTGEDLLFQVMLDLGIELSAKIETRQIAGKTVHLVNDNYLVACFDRDVTEAAIKEIAQLHPVYFVMRDASAANDNVIDNFEQIFRHYSPDTNCRII